MPEAAPAPPHVIACDGLSALGLRFGGRPLLEATVAELVAAVKARSV